MSLLKYLYKSLFFSKQNNIWLLEKAYIICYNLTVISITIIKY